MNANIVPLNTPSSWMELIEQHIWSYIFHIKLKGTRIVRESDYSPAAALFIK